MNGTTFYLYRREGLAVSKMLSVGVYSQLNKIARHDDSAKRFAATNSQRASETWVHVRGEHNITVAQDSRHKHAERFARLPPNSDHGRGLL